MTRPSQAFPIWRLERPLVLASASKARAALLRQAAVPCDVSPAAIDERAAEESLGANAASANVAVHLALEKAKAVCRGLPGRLVLGSDQVLDFQGQRLHKAASRAGALAQLGAMAGREHRLISAFALVRDGVAVAQGAAEAVMTMRRLSSEAIARYLDVEGADALSTVGGYRLEGLGAQLFERIAGDYFTILGLPLLDVLAALRQCGALSDEPAGGPAGTEDAP
jgi:septum formation protein